MPVHGHTPVLNALRAELPQISLFIGPASVGKWTVAENLAAYHRFPEVQRVRTLTADAARSLARLVQYEPPEGRMLAIVRLQDYTEQRIPQNILLKTLEEPGENVSVILISHDTVAETVASRAHRIDFGLLTNAAVQSVLRSRGLPDHEVESLSAMAHGRIGQALRMAELMERKALVLTAMRAIQERNAPALLECADAWTDEHTTTAVAWCYEVITLRDKARLFTLTELAGADKKTATRILMALRDDHRPRLVVRGALAGVLEALS